jgi:hypothetical protein
LADIGCFLELVDLLVLRSPLSAGVSKDERVSLGSSFETPALPAPQDEGTA